MQKWLLILSFSALLIGSFVGADPISKEEADAWVSHVRNVMHWPPGFDVRGDAEERQKLAEHRLSISPENRTYIRDLADALHSLGHFAEHDHDFLAAMRLHQKSLHLYLQSGMKAKESFDGPRHALEHIFMDAYDHGIVLERQGKIKEARRYFEMAYNQAAAGLLSQFADELFDGRIHERLVALVQRFNPPVKVECKELLPSAS